MSLPTYDGKGQPTEAKGWLSGLTAWWHSLTPQYVTRASSGVAAAAHADKASMTTSGSLGAPSGVASESCEPPGALSEVGGTGPNAPSAAKL